MRLSASNSVPVAIFVFLVGCSIGLKAAIGAAPSYAMSDKNRQRLEQLLVAALNAEGFSTTVRPLKFQSSIVYAKKGDCRLSVRDARAGAAAIPAFVHDAQNVGDIRYLYRGNSYSSFPALRIHFDLLEGSLLHSVGLRPKLYLPLAFAASAGCSTGALGLQNIQLTTRH